jgi:hypothetical protein
VLKIVQRGKKGIYQIVGKCPATGAYIRESTGTNSQRHAEQLRAKREAALLEEALRLNDPRKPALQQDVKAGALLQRLTAVDAPSKGPPALQFCSPQRPTAPEPSPAVDVMPSAANQQESEPGKPTPMFMTVMECRATLPIRMSRRSLVGIIKAAGPEYYQEWRRQLFLTPDQWAAIATRIKAPCSRLPRGGRRASFKTPIRDLSPEEAYARALALTQESMPRRKARS